MVGATAPSHVHPSLAVIRELVRRGHRVSYAIGDELVPLVAATGAAPVAHPSLLPSADDPDTAWGEDAVAGMRLFLEEGIAVLPHLLRAFADDPPELVLHDIGGLARPLLAHRHGVPAVQLSPTFVAWEGYEEEMAEQTEALRASEAGAAFYARFRAWLAEHGVDREPDDVLGRPERCIALIPRVLQPNADRVRPAVRFVGPCIDPERLAAGGWAPPPGAGRVLYVAFGTAFTDQLPVYRACIEAVAGSGWHLVMALGRYVDPADLGPLPAGVEVHRAVDQLAVLARASAFVTHAGMGSTVESLWYGVPTVAIPQAVDQFANAARLEEIGAGRHLPADEVTPDALADAVHVLADDPAVAARLAAIRDEVRGAGGVARAADAVEQDLPAARG